MAEEYDYLFKSIVVGDGGVGKTALTLRFSKGFFTEDYKMTIGVDFHVKTISIDADEGPIRSKLQIWDTGGQERFSSIRPMYYRGSLGALLIFDLTNSATFEHLPGWIEEVRANIKTEIPFLLVGNKSDLVDQRAITLEEINNFTRNFNLYYMETSAKTGEGVGDCFYILACLMIGSGVPNQLLSNGIVFGPGQISTVATESYTPDSPQVQPDFDYSAPPVPEPAGTINQEPEPAFTINQEPEPTFKTETEFDFEAPPVPEPKYIEPPSSSPPFEPEIPIPEPSIEDPLGVSKDFEFKTPEEILAEEDSAAPVNTEVPHFEDSIVSTTQETYKPKAIPFTSSVPVPAPTPEAFQSPQDIPAPTSDSLTDYMPEPIISKKEKKQKKKEEKEREKQKKKEEKERKAHEEKERQQKLNEEKEKSKKEKKEKKEKPKKEKKEKKEKSAQLPTPQTSVPTTPESTSTPSLFQTLTQKPEEAPKPPSSAFVPFSNGEEPQTQTDTKLRIIPNVADIESKPSGFTPLSPSASQPKEPGRSSNKELIICKSCGAILSSDYAFCNKCGSHL
ncbi:MAG: GTP-binding protein [Promethearchaeota archaeon]|jgi:Ras-related protein Rab-11A